MECPPPKQLAFCSDSFIRGFALHIWFGPFLTSSPLLFPTSLPFRSLAMMMAFSKILLSLFMSFRCRPEKNIVSSRWLFAPTFAQFFNNVILIYNFIIIIIWRGYFSKGIIVNWGLRCEYGYPCLLVLPLFELNSQTMDFLMGTSSRVGPCILK